ncbi:MAG: DJ-1/PfpI family protein [Fibrobacteraceae bacterium]|nr:DJ-1/PfpI family protein [Fibrobacteraceae bacterium]
MNILFLMADGFEETEFVTPFDYLQRAGMEVYMASISDSTAVQGGHGLVIEADGLLCDLNVDAFDAVLLPGGGVGVQNLGASQAVLDVVKGFDDAGKFVFAICAAPTVLSKAGVLLNRRATCYPGCETNMNCKEFSTDRVVVDGKFVTSRGAGTAEEFSFAIIEILGGAELKEKIRAQVVARL